MSARPAARAPAAPRARPAVLTAADRLAGAVRPREGGPAWLVERRAEAVAALARSGLMPDREAWRTTKLDDLAAVAWQDVPAPDGATCNVPRLPVLANTHRLVFVDGRIQGGPARDLPGGAVVASLAANLHLPQVQAALGRIETGARHGAAHLNTARFEDGALVVLPRGTRVERPIHLVFAATGERTWNHPRTLILAEPNAEATVVEHYVGAGPGPTFTNAVTEVSLGGGGILRHVRLQEEQPTAHHLSGVAVRLGRDSTLEQENVQVGAALARTTIEALLADEGATARLDGLFLARGTQRTDTYTRIDHAVPHGTSSELYKGVLAGRARGAFTGNVLVRPGAQQTTSEQENRNLLLSEEALVDATPQLEIHADDVKCSHGSTVGQLDEDQLFFLRARGIGQARARALLVQGFAREVVQRVPVPALRERLDVRVAAWLGEEATA